MGVHRGASEIAGIGSLVFRSSALMRCVVYFLGIFGRVKSEACQAVDWGIVVFGRGRGVVTLHKYRHYEFWVGWGVLVCFLYAVLAEWLMQISWQYLLGSSESEGSIVWLLFEVPFHVVIQTTCQW